MLTPEWQTAEQRLIERRVVDPLTGCWIWDGAKDRQGYGRIAVIGVSNAYRVHRAAAVLWLGLDPAARKVPVLHKCDRKPCFYPEHIVVRNQSANKVDAVLKAAAGIEPGEMERVRALYRSEALRRVEESVNEASTEDERAVLETALARLLVVLHNQRKRCFS